MIETTKKNGYYEAVVKIASGVVAGTGYGGTRANAVYFAAQDAIDSEVPCFVDAGNFAMGTEVPFYDSMV